MLQTNRFSRLFSGSGSWRCTGTSHDCPSSVSFRNAKQTSRRSHRGPASVAFDNPKPRSEARGRWKERCSRSKNPSRKSQVGVVRQVGPVCHGSPSRLMQATDSLLYSGRQQDGLARHL